MQGRLISCALKLVIHMGNMVLHPVHSHPLMYVLHISSTAPDFQSSVSSHFSIAGFFTITVLQDFK